MQTHVISSHTVHSSFDYAYTETLLRSFVAIVTASSQQGFDNLPEPEQERLLKEFYTRPIPPPLSGDGKEHFVKEPFVFQLEDGERVLINASNGQWFVLLESDMLSFTPPQ
jgi:hypothetical protein